MSPGAGIQQVPESSRGWGSGVLDLPRPPCWLSARASSCVMTRSMAPASEVPTAPRSVGFLSAGASRLPSDGDGRETTGRRRDQTCPEAYRAGAHQPRGEGLGRGLGRSPGRGRAGAGRGRRAEPGPHPRRQVRSPASARAPGRAADRSCTRSALDSGGPGWVSLVQDASASGPGPRLSPSQPPRKRPCSSACSLSHPANSSVPPPLAGADPGLREGRRPRGGGQDTSPSLCVPRPAGEAGSLALGREGTALEGRWGNAPSSGQLS